MYRWSKIPEEYRPEIISDINDDSFFTFTIWDKHHTKRIKRKDVQDTRFVQAGGTSMTGQDSEYWLIVNAWEGYYSHTSNCFRNIIDNNISCIVMHKVNNKRDANMNLVVLFMTGECNDVFLVSPGDLSVWRPNEAA